VRDVQPTRLDEGDGVGDAKLFEDGEVVHGGEENGAALGTGGLVVVIEHGELAERVPGEEVSAAIGQQLLQAVYFAWLCSKPGGDGGCIRNNRDWPG